jgi:hypothetical protein
MPVSTHVYGSLISALATGKVNLSSDALKVMLVSSGYVPNQAEDPASEARHCRPSSAVPARCQRLRGHLRFPGRDPERAAAQPSSSSASIRAIFGVRPSSSRAMLRIASSSRSSESITSRSRMCGA